MRLEQSVQRIKVRPMDIPGQCSHCSASEPGFGILVARHVSPRRHLLKSLHSLLRKVKAASREVLMQVRNRRRAWYEQNIG